MLWDAREKEKMKNNLLRSAICIAFVLLITISCIVTVSASSDAARAREIKNGIIDHCLEESRAASIDDFIENALCDGAGRNSEWYALSLSQCGEWDLSEYEEALLSFLSENKISSHSTRLKYAICLAASGSTDRYISETMNVSIGAQGIMSHVFGLHLLNNGYVSEMTINGTVNAILELQREDGGWRVTGNSSDVDVSAMAIQALAPLIHEREDVRVAVEHGLDFLSSAQLGNGAYMSYGVENLESTAQVLIALCSLNIDPLTDERFIKDGNDIFDGMILFRLDDGSFSHTEKGDSNKNATVQALCGTVAYLRMIDGKDGLYMLDRCRPEEVERAEHSDRTDMSVAEGEETDAITERPEGLSYKPFVCGGLVVAALIILIILAARKRLNLKNTVAVLLALCVLITVVIFTDIRSPKGYYGESESRSGNGGSVTLTIRCDVLDGVSNAGYIPDDYVILDTVTFEIDDGENVYDLLMDAARAYEIRVENSGTAEMAYISGIGDIYEFDFGDLSGWVFLINGERSSVGCSEVILTDGDAVEWRYTLDMGRDIEQ